MIFFLPLLICLSSPFFVSPLVQGLHVEVAQEFNDEVFVRSKRSTTGGDICKYKKGDWSQCDQLTQLVTRHDNLKLKASNGDCASTRTLTRNCREEHHQEGTVTCAFKKSKSVTWTSCLPSGVRQKVLDLVTQTGKGTCPKQKLLSRKCKDEKKLNEKKDKKKKKKKEKKEEESTEKKADKKEGKKEDKCSFGDWGSWGDCVKGNQQRIRKVKKGSERPNCQKKAVSNRTCQV